MAPMTLIKPTSVARRPSPGQPMNPANRTGSQRVIASSSHLKVPEMPAGAMGNQNRQIPKSQIPISKSQTPKLHSKHMGSKEVGFWGFEFWDLFGIWGLGFGV